MPFDMDDRPDEIVYSPQCVWCSRLLDLGQGRRCEAFPDGIPEAIWRGEQDHRLPAEGDRGLRFDPVSGLGEREQAALFGEGDR